MKFSRAIAGLALGSLASAFNLDLNKELLDALNTDLKNPTLPDLPGPYEVGSKRIFLTDTSRKDPWANVTMDRMVVIQIWYPIKNGSSTVKAPYLPPNATKYTNRRMTLPKGTVDKMVTHMFEGGSPINPLVTKEGVLPIVVFSPGSGAISAEYTTFNAPLASNGYITIGMDHPYDSSPVEMPNGELLMGNLGDHNHTLNAIATGVRRDDAMFLAKQITAENLAKWLPGWSASSDATPVTSFKLGIYGQSLGGSTASLCMQNADSPYKGALSFDGPFYGEITKDGMNGPFVYFAAQNSETHDSLNTEWPLIRGWKEAYTMLGTTHYDYSDLNVLVPQAKGTLLAAMYGPKLGPIGPIKRTDVIADYLKGFFNFALDGQPAADYLTKPTAEFPMIQFDSPK